MARLIFPDGGIEHDRDVVTVLAARLGARLRHRAPPPHPAVAEPVPDDNARAALLAATHAHLADWLAAAGQRAGGRDLVVFHPAQAELAELRARFLNIHTHADDEVRYILAGTGYFGLVDDGGAQVLLEVGPGDWLEVAAGTAHWFALGDDPHLKAARYFGAEARWQATPVDHAIHPALLALTPG